MGVSARGGARRENCASTKQLNAMLHRLHADDRVLLVGDTRQHQAIDAGRPYQQFQEAGIAVARLDDIVRQKDPAPRLVIDTATITIAPAAAMAIGAALQEPALKGPNGGRITRS
jgi:hypothetical protein